MSVNHLVTAVPAVLARKVGAFMSHLIHYTEDYKVRFASQETGEIFEKIEHLKNGQTVEQLYRAYEYFGWYVIDIIPLNQGK